jgi:alpha-ribazole phosphatase
MDILIVRHTRVAVDPKYCYGTSDIPLAKSFPTEASSVKERLTKWFPFDKVYSSPLSRALKLAQYLQNGDIIQDDRLQEIEFGQWEMKSWKEIGLEKFSSWVKNGKLKEPSLENYEDVTIRVVEFLNEIIQTNSGEKILITTHSGVMRCILSYYSGAPLSSIFNFRIAYGGILHLKYREFSEEDYEKYPNILLPEMGIKGFL